MGLLHWSSWWFRIYCGLCCFFSCHLSRLLGFFSNSLFVSLSFYRNFSIIQFWGHSSLIRFLLYLWCSPSQVRPSCLQSSSSSFFDKLYVLVVLTGSAIPLIIHPHPWLWLPKLILWPSTHCHPLLVWLSLFEWCCLSSLIECWWCFIKLRPLASSLDHPPVVSGRVSVIPVMHWDVHQLVVIKKLLKFLVTTHWNGTQLLLGPRV